MRPYEAHQHRHDGALEKDSEDQAVQVQNDEVVDSLEEEARIELGQVEHALERLANGLGDECGKALHQLVCEMC